MGYLYAIAAAIVWGSAGLFIKLLNSSGMSSISILVVRGATISLLMCLMASTKPSFFKVQIKDLPLIVISGINLVIFNQGLFIYSMTLAGMALTTVLHYTAPAFVIVISYFAFREPITRHKIAALGSSCVGLILAAGLFKGSLNASPLALLTGIASGLAYGLHTIFFKQLVKKYDSLTANLWAVLIGTAVVASFAVPSGSVTLPQSPIAWLYLFVLSAGPGFLSFYLFGLSLKYVEASRASIIATIEPVSAAVLGYMFLPESLDLLQLFGMGLVILGVILAGLTGKPPAESATCRGQPFLVQRRMSHYLGSFMKTQRF